MAMSIKSQLLGNKNNLFGNIQNDILLVIYSFLSFDDVSITQIVCTNWNKIFNNYFQKKIFYHVPKDISLSKSFETLSTPLTIAEIENKVYVKSRLYLFTLDSDSKLIEEKDDHKYKKLICKKEKYICLYNEGDIDIYSDEKLEYRISKMEGYKKMIIDDYNNAIIMTNHTIYIYSIIDKKKVEELDFRHIINNCLIIETSIACNRKKIFINDYYLNCIHVFSYKGKLLKSLGKSKKSSYLKGPQGITIYKDIIFVSDSENKIKVFTSGGKFVTEYLYKETLSTIVNIIFMGKYVYLGDWYKNKFLKYDLIY